MLKSGHIFRLVPFLLIAALFYSGTMVFGRPQNLQQLADIMKRLVSVPLPGHITALFQPRYDTAREADLKLTGSEPVFITIFPDGARIYPQQYMVWHQVVNEIVDDHAYAVTYCPITGTLMSYDATMEDINLSFEVEGHNTAQGYSGYLYDGNTVLKDSNTGSLWLQETGMAFDGPLLGRGMPTLPVFWTTWEAAKKVYPNAPVLARPRGRRPYGRDPYGSYAREDTYYQNDALAYAVRRSDKRFKRKTPMLCLEYENLLMAIDIGYVKKQGAVNFFVGPTALLAAHDPVLDVVRVFNRQVWAEPFLFTMRDGRLTDLTTRSVWNPATGEAISGNLKGAVMKQYYGVYSMWFAWYSMNPETLYIPGPGEVPAKLLSTEQPGIEGGKPVEAPAPVAPDGLPGSPTW